MVNTQYKIGDTFYHKFYGETFKIVSIRVKSSSDELTQYFIRYEDGDEIVIYEFILQMDVNRQKYVKYETEKELLALRLKYPAEYQDYDD